jgi:hypothetical protein
MGEEIIRTMQKNFAHVRKLSAGDDPHILLSKTYLGRLRGRGIDINNPSIGLQVLSDTILFACLPDGQNIRALALKVLFDERPDIKRDFPKFEQEFDMIMGPFFQKVEKGIDLKKQYFDQNKHRQIEHLAPEVMYSLEMLSEQFGGN